MTQFLNTSKEIRSWLESVGIDNKNVKLDTTGPIIIVNVSGDVKLNEIRLTQLPVQFGLVERTFHVGSNRLTSLQGCPKVVGSRFVCSYNNLTSLEGGPDYVGEHYYCLGNKLTNLKGVAYNIKGALFAGMNNLNSLEFLPLAATEINIMSNPLLGDMQDIKSFNELKIIQKAELEKLQLSNAIERVNSGNYNEINITNFKI